jgi:hypothetical protein
MNVSLSMYMQRTNRYSASGGFAVLTDHLTKFGKKKYSTIADFALNSAFQERIQTAVDLK